MARRPKHLHPQPRLHAKTGHARVRIAGETFWLGRYGSPQAATEYDRLIGEWLASGKSRPPSRRPGTADASLADALPPQAHAAPWNRTPRLQTDQPQKRVVPQGRVDDGVTLKYRLAHDADGLTVGELCTRWIDWIERNRCHNGKDATSLYYGARQATAALEDFWSLPAASFGSHHLTAVQEKLEHTPVVSRPRSPDKAPKVRARNRSTINDTIGRIRRLFRWAAVRNLVPEDRVAVLRLVEPLLAEQTAAPDRVGPKTVPDEIVSATLPELPAVIADLIRFQRLVGCRPGEARRLRPCDINRDASPDRQGVWLWTPYRYKTKWRKKHLPRVIAIGPKAQAILTPWLARLSRTPESHVFSPKFSARRATGGSKRATSETPLVRVKQRRVNDVYSKDSLNQAIERGCARASVPKWTANQLRHNKLTEVRANVSVDAAQAIGGHANINQTEHYAQVQVAKAIDAAARFG
jgi:integrase